MFEILIVFYTEIYLLVFLKRGAFILFLNSFIAFILELK